MIWLIGWILLWFRPEYKFVLFFGLGLLVLNFVLWLLFAGIPIAITTPINIEGVLTFLMLYLADAVLTLLVFGLIGIGIVALRKWMKARRSPKDKELDVEMERIRAEIAAREGRS